jgi:hypothetical protein
MIIEDNDAALTAWAREMAAALPLMTDDEVCRAG